MCRSTAEPTQPESDASGSLGDTASPPQLDAPVSSDASSDSSSRDSSLPDRSSQDSPPDRSSQDSPSVAVEDCGRGRQDASVPPDASCPSPDDTDRDGLPDCIDGCPYDTNKVAPGACGCGTPEIDRDGDNIADCIDRCPEDPNNMAPGQCGCVGMQGLKPAGTSCTDPACPQPGAVCDGAGVCGDRSSCSPCFGGHFVISGDGREYWFCGASLPPVTVPGCVERDGGAGPSAGSIR